MDYLIAVLGGYLLGSIPFGLVLTRMAGLGDIRQVGSGNIGATNVLRTGRKDVALATLVLDAAKAAAALVLARHFFSADAGMLAGAAALLGHCFPIWLKFKGGKGVATFFGTLLVGSWPVGVLAGALWLATAFTFRYSSLGALVASAAAPLLAVVFQASPIGIGATLFMSVLVWIRHRENLSRLIKGEEPKIGKK
ncbi:putative glycerol-3-phosphate acyltransferase [Candidatus Phycosocius bacilliformis]|uniref:Glycerol-3-phosphate acyltransferase n=1 Tax=Candidatus Phycosocius bacilliformis TaxID=1445552 RepID=A0A2P2EAN5_9PROT|nr:glycerol-3-phosphate 1-O-acyltransferase PlsY [Candidatus Phycosocius bacilliformis]GBF58120.1 putative glycerol-3-phosphate acyltransferase [Candidatus Phycosocius bacilliformis]